MKDYIIYNGTSPYGDRSVGAYLLKNYQEDLVAKMKSESRAKYLVVNEDSSLDIEGLRGQVGKLELIEVGQATTFIYGEGSVLENLVEGEKPLPSGESPSVEVQDLEGLLNLESKTLYIGGSIENPGFFQVDKKISLGDLLGLVQVEGKFKAIYLGHPMGDLYSKDDLDQVLDLACDYVEIYTEDNCILEEIARISRVYGDESCGKCNFGYEGTNQINMILSDVENKKGKLTDLALLTDLTSMMLDQSLCSMGEALARTISTALEKFRPEIKGHISKKECQASRCSKFMTYHILMDQCVGCGECMDSCDDDAIEGKKNFIHIIDQDECIQCGKCLESCQYGAIIKAGKDKPIGVKRPIPCKRKK